MDIEEWCEGTGEGIPYVRGRPNRLSREPTVSGGEGRIVSLVSVKLVTEIAELP